VGQESLKYGQVTSVLIFEVLTPGFAPEEAVRIFVQFDRSESATKVSPACTACHSACHPACHPAFVAECWSRPLHGHAWRCLRPVALMFPHTSSARCTHFTASLALPLRPVSPVCAATFVGLWALCKCVTFPSSAGRSGVSCEKYEWYQVPSTPVCQHACQMCACTRTVHKPARLRTTHTSRWGCPGHAAAAMLVHRPSHTMTPHSASARRLRLCHASSRRHQLQ
jgi:hypothetical protein